MGEGIEEGGWEQMATANGYRVSFGSNEHVLKFTTLNALNPLNLTLSMGKLYNRRIVSQ